MDTGPIAITLIISFLVAWSVGIFYIPLLRQWSFGQTVREDGPQSHQTKTGTPTTGGILVFLGTLAGLIYVLVTQPMYFTQEVVVALGAFIALGTLGLWDDLMKIMKKHNKGVTGYTKLAIQILVGLAVGGYIMVITDQTWVTVFHWGKIDLGWLYPLFGALVVTATSNAVNLTDGLDGLAGSTLICAFFTIGYLCAGFGLTEQAPVYPDLALLCTAIIGGLFGFLLFNLHPAKIFMGDAGSLALGGVLGALALLTHLDAWLVLIGGIFVLETLSVIIQVISFKTMGKRVFKMSPIHHHFELCGWKETMVVALFVSIQSLLCFLAIFLYNRF